MTRFQVLLGVLCCVWAQTNGFLQRDQKACVFRRPYHQTADSVSSSSLKLKTNGGNDSSDGPSDQLLLSRRDLLQVATTGALSILASPLAANAAAPLTEDEANSVKVRAQRKLRQKPVQTLRPRLNEDFASLLITASYQSLDEIDCVPMDQYQRDFAVIRDAEYEQYAADLGSRVSTDMTDPNFFDFLSFAQYSAINREVSKDAPFVFTEQKPVSMVADIMTKKSQEVQYGPTTIVKRDAALTNDLLSAEHSHRVASAILDHFDDKYGGTDVALPSLPLNTRPGSATLLTTLNQLVTLFLMNGYAFSGSASIGKEGTAFGDASGTKFVLTLTAPATLWSGQALQLQGKTDKTIQLHNDFLLKTAKEVMTRCGYRFTAQTMNYEETTQSVTTFTIG